MLSLLGPIGDCRPGYTICSKGRRIKNRKARREILLKNPVLGEEIKPVHPELQNFVTIGFNSTTRHLEILAQSSIPSSLSNEKPSAGFNEGILISEPLLSSCKLSNLRRPLVAVFATNREQSPFIYTHLPALIKMASQALSPLPAIRLVTLPSGAEACLCKALNLPRISLIGLLKGAPGASELMDLISVKVPAVVIPWLEIAEAGQFSPTKVEVVHTSSLNEIKKGH